MVFGIFLFIQRIEKGFMRYAIFSDVHGNLESLVAVLSALKKERIDQYYFCGDIVGYGANPKECIEEIKKINAICIAGNHDWAVAGAMGVENFNLEAQEAIRWTAAELGDEDKEFLRNLKLVEHQNNFILVHGTLNNPEEFHYLVGFDQVVRSFSLMDRMVCFVGHSHVPKVFVENQGETVKEHSGFRVALKDNCRYLVNVGSVGQPRDGNPQAAYCIFDSKNKTIEITRIGYDIKSAQNKIYKVGLPQGLGDRLSTGR